jgi:hypothetical protein
VKCVDSEWDVDQIIERLVNFFLEGFIRKSVVVGELARTIIRSGKKDSLNQAMLKVGSLISLLRVRNGHEPHCVESELGSRASIVLSNTGTQKSQTKGRESFSEEFSHCHCTISARFIIPPLLAIILSAHYSL